MAVLWVCCFLTCLGLGATQYATGSTATRITLNNGGYENVYVGILETVPENTALVTAIMDWFRDGSTMLHRITRSVSRSTTSISCFLLGGGIGFADRLVRAWCSWCACTRWFDHDFLWDEDPQTVPHSGCGAKYALTHDTHAPAVNPWYACVFEAGTENQFANLC